MQAHFTPVDTYLTDETYAALRAELVELITLQPLHADTEVVRVLGEVGGVWPQSVMDDAERENLSEVA